MESIINKEVELIPPLSFLRLEPFSDLCEAKLVRVHNRNKIELDLDIFAH
jgi:hypothetical protein